MERRTTMSSFLNSLIFCTNCDAVISTSFSQQPEFSLLPNGKVVSISHDDFAEFLRAHQGHRLGNLTVMRGPWSHRPFWEPVKEEFFEVTDGRRLFILKRWREKIDEPMQYELLSGSLRYWVERTEVEAKAIKCQLKRERPNLPDEEIDSFVEITEYTLRMQRFYADDADHVLTIHPLMVYGSMDDIGAVYLKRNARRLFRGQEAFIESFIERERNTVNGGVLAAKLTLGFAFKQAT